MTPDFIIKFVEELMKYIWSGQLTYETEDNCLFKFSWTDGYSDYNFILIVPCDKYIIKDIVQPIAQKIIDIQEIVYQRWSEYEHRKE